MERDKVKQFEVWWADLREPAGRRPVLLLSRNDAYGYLSKFVAAEITSTIRQIASEVPLGEEEGLSKACVANCDNLRMVGRLSLTNRAGELAPQRWIEVKRAVGAALGWRELTDLD
jgi:mRNA interferase MazF